MQKQFDGLLLFLLTTICIVFAPSAVHAQPPMKGWLIDFEGQWIESSAGYHRFKITLGTNPPTPVTEDMEFQVVVKQYQGSRVSSLTITPIVVKAGKSSAQLDVLVNKTNASYNSHCNVHIENDGNLNYEANRDLFSAYVPNAGNYVGEVAGLPTILIVASGVTHSAKKFIRTKKRLVELPTNTIFAIDENNFPAINALFDYYPDQNGQLNPNNNKNPTALDALESPFIHAVAPSNMPRNWLALTSAEIVLISFEDLSKFTKDREQFGALQKWTAAGGTLVVNNCGAAFQKAEKVRALVDGRRSFSARKKNPWMIPGDRLKKLKKFVVDELDQPNYYGNQTNNNVIQKSETSTGRARSDWNILAESDDLKQAIADSDYKFAMYKYVLGRVVVVGDNMTGWKIGDWRQLLNTAMIEDRTLRERFGSNRTDFPADRFAIEGAGKPPVREFQVLIGLFVLLIGPVSYFILKRQRRLQLLFVTVPAISACACVGLMLYALLSDGFENKGRMRSFTALDHSRQRAVSFVRHSHYAGVQPRGYRFENDAAVFNGRAWGSPRSVVRREPAGTIVNGGDIRPRMPHQLVSIHNYETEKRLAILSGVASSQAPRVRNEFDNPIRLAVFRTEQGYFFVENLGPGETATGQRIETTGKTIRSTDFNRDLQKLLLEISPNVSDEFFNLNSYAYDPYYGYSYSNLDRPASVECDHRWILLRKNVDQFFKQPGYYLAILEEYSEIVAQQTDIVYKNKLHIIHGKW